MEILYYPKAQDDLLNIYLTTDERWGESQADKYVSGLYTSVKLASKQQKPWQKYENMNKEALRPIYFVSYKRHLIFFEVLETENILAVIAVLYDGMDIPNRINEIIEIPEQ